MPETVRTPTTIPTPLGVGIVGLGEIGQVHLQGFLRADGARVAAVTDLDAALTASTAEAAGAAAYPDLEALLADAAVDVVSVCLPHRLHRPVALAAIAAGKHVLLEKPLALTVEECDEIIAAAEAAGVKVGVQHNQLYYPAHVRARVADGRRPRRPRAFAAAPRDRRQARRLAGRARADRRRPALRRGRPPLLRGARPIRRDRRRLGHGRSRARRGRGPRDRLAALCQRRARRDRRQLPLPTRRVRRRDRDRRHRRHVVLSGCEAEFEGFRTGPALRRYDGAWSDVRVPGGDWVDSVAASIADFVQAVASGAEPPVSACDGRDVVALIRAAYANESVGGKP